MKELLLNYSIQDILIFLVIFALAFKGFISFFEWLTEWLRKKFKKEQKAEKQEDTIQSLSTKVDALNKTVTELANQVTLLLDSDKDDIKAYLTREHHYFVYQKGWIDDYSLECCEHRFKHYQAEGGNSFIENFMNELRALPKQPPRP